MGCAGDAAPRRHSELAAPDPGASLARAPHVPAPTPAPAPQVATYDVVGPVCESADFLGKER